MAKPNAHAPLGQGGRFAAVEAKAKASGARNPAAVAAAAGRKKYGAVKMAKLSAAGRKSAHGSGEFSEQERKQGYMVMCDAEHLNQMDVDRLENIPKEYILASRRESNMGGHSVRKTFRRSESTKADEGENYGKNGLGY